jgi:hypothetical protein
LCSDGIAPWLDEEDLLPGQDWALEIPKAVRAADIVIVCLSQGSVTKAGYIQKEIKFALDIADEQPEGHIFLIPVKLEECNVPTRLQRWHWVNLYQERGYERLMRSLGARSDQVALNPSIPVRMNQLRMDLEVNASKIPHKAEHKGIHRKDHRVNHKAEHRSLRS